MTPRFTGKSQSWFGSRLGLRLGSIALFLSLWSINAQNWTETSTPTIYNWYSLASSADGTKLVAVGYGQPGSGAVYISTNSGATWHDSHAPWYLWQAVASSADGKCLAVAANSPDGFILTSTNGGLSWSSNKWNYWTSWNCIASSADGSHLIAGSNSAIYTSTNSGLTWTSNNLPLGPWLSVSSSADGTKLAGLFDVFGAVYISTNAGVSWAAITNIVNSGSSWWPWPSVASSADGTHLIVTGNPTYTSTDSGKTWLSNDIPWEDWLSVASSADGTRLVLTGRIICTSTNFGETWVTNTTPLTNTYTYWGPVTSSADGARLVAAPFNGPVYTSESTPAPLLGVTQNDMSFVLSWVIPSMNFVLQQAPDLTSSNWTSVPETPSLNYSNLQYQVSITKPQGTMFYRLISQ